MFRGSTVLATGGTYIHHADQRQLHYSAVKGGFDLLQENVAPAAFHNSGERAEPPKCHPNTRVTVQRKIMDWIMGLDVEALNALIMWLNGPAGTGKSAIAQSIAELCFAKGDLLASYFFSRSDSSRNHGRSLFPTIAYQISTIIPSTREQILLAIDRDPLIFTRSLATQFSALVIEPLKSLVDSGYFSHPNSPRLIIIDGLDECLDRQVQRAILDIISDASLRFRIPLIFLICSRPEYEIASAIGSADFRGIHDRVVLDASYRPDDDIRLFLRDKFEGIKKSHPLKQLIPSSWPTVEAMDSLVQKSSGQFIYASTVIKYVASPRHRPTERLNVVLNIRPAGGDEPFAELDALYIYILSSVEDIERVLHVLSFILLSTSTVRGIEETLSLGPGEVQILFCDLGSIVGQVQDEDGSGEYYLKIWHASLPDFLLDAQRSKNFFVDLSIKRNEHLLTCFRLMSDRIDANLKLDFIAVDFITYNIQDALPTREMRDAIIEFSPEPIYAAALERNVLVMNRYIFCPAALYFIFVFLPIFFGWLKHAKFEDGAKLYALKLKSFHYILSTYYQDGYLPYLATILNHSTPLPPWNRAWKLPETFGEIIDRISCLDWPQKGVHLKGSKPRIDIFPGDLKFLAEILEHPQFSEDEALNGTSYAAAALRCLKYLCNHRLQAPLPRFSAYEKETRHNIPWIWRTRSTRRRSVTLKPQERGEEKEIDGRKQVYGFALHCLPYLLSRSEKSDELVDFVVRHTFAMLSPNFWRVTKRARRAITKYLQRIESNKMSPIPSESASSHGVVVRSDRPFV